ncbi:MAG: hypothetical protein CM1200mP14_04740 [Gammaproteobacteria bacterium]|nr:MAG: hypothetical protein CM1200mP14_04740 [Gammaproteobacteria bacterium]
MKRIAQSCVLMLLMGQLIGFPIANPSVAQESPEATLQALPLQGNLELDGRILEDFWSSAVPITDFTQQEPVEGGVPSEETEIRVLFDEDNLYIGVIIYDDPEEVLAYQRERDAIGYRRPVHVDPGHVPGRSDRVLLRDQRSRPHGRRHLTLQWRWWWTFRWRVRWWRYEQGVGRDLGGTYRDASRWLWAAEIRIPFRTLNFDPDNDTWGINFQRTIRRRNEEILWRGWRRTEGLRRPIYAGRMTGLQNLSQGLGLEAVPSTIVGLAQHPRERRTDHSTA